METQYVGVEPGKQPSERALDLGVSYPGQKKDEEGEESKQHFGVFFNTGHLQ